MKIRANTTITEHKIINNLFLFIKTPKQKPLRLTYMITLKAFIIFATDEDARRAVSRSGGFIKDSSVELFLSSKVDSKNLHGFSPK